MRLQRLKLQNVMSLITAPPLPLLLLLMVSGVHSQWSAWSVTYTPSHICALKDSTVIMRCTYSYPPGHQIRKVFWTKADVKDDHGEYLDLYEDRQYRWRLQYSGDRTIIQLNHVTLKDSLKYYFRFITDKTEGKWTGVPGVRLNITDLQLESPERVTEGDSVHLTCKSSCELTDRPTFIWSKNSQRLTSANTGNKLTLSPVRRGDAGRYRCAVDGHTLTSNEVQLNVMYPPDKPVISINGSAEIVEGDSVSLICSSDSNPPAEILWFKWTKYLKSLQTYSISKISSNDSGEYKCKASNTHGEKYSTVTLNVMYPPRNVSVSISGSAEIAEGDSVSLICSSDSNPPAEIHWFKGETFVGSGRIHSISNISSDDSGEYKCKTSNKHGEKYSDAVTLNIAFHSGWHIWLGIILGCVGLFIIIIIIVFMMKKQRAAEAEDLTAKQENLYSDITGRDVHVSESADHEAPYASVSSTTERNLETEDVQYVSVLHQKHKPKKRPEEDDCHYGNITIQQPHAALRRSKVEMVEEACVIYSSVK